MKIFSEQERNLIRLIQDSIPLVPLPLAEIAQKTGVDENTVIARINGWISGGLIRRFGGVVRHNKIHRTVNVMSVWNVPLDDIDSVASIISNRPEVSHCYHRHGPQGWNYPLFAMIHAESEEHCRRIIDEIAHKTGIRDYQLLFTVKEFKKTSLSLF